VIELKRNGHKVVLVSSGAIGVGLKRMNLAKRPENLAGKQVRFLSTFAVQELNFSS
jgi:glutamate 5-kinase